MNRSAPDTSLPTLTDDVTPLVWDVLTDEQKQSFEEQWQEHEERNARSVAVNSRLAELLPPNLHRAMESRRLRMESHEPYLQALELLVSMIPAGFDQLR